MEINLNKQQEEEEEKQKESPVETVRVLQGGKVRLAHMNVECINSSKTQNKIRYCIWYFYWSS